VTILFCDVVRSTELALRVDAESLRKVLTRYFEEVRGTIEHHGGVVEKFIGDAVLAVFGAPRAQEDHALRAVRAASEIRATIADLNMELHQSWGITLEVAIGLNSGHVVVGDGTAGHAMVTGSAVILAARLESAAAPGEILLSSETYRLVRDAVEAQPIQGLSLKGLPDERAAHRLIRLQDAGAVPARRLDSPLVGREPQMQLLVDTLERCAAGRQCHLVTVLGAAGIGKSRLAAEFVADAMARAAVLHGRCLPYGEGITFRPVAEMIAQAARIRDLGAPDDAWQSVRDLLRDQERGETVVERVGELLGLKPASAPPEETFWAIRRVFESLARKEPLVLVFDDVHWAQPMLLDLLEHLAERIRDVPLEMLCLGRPELLEVRPGWGEGILNSSTIHLESLSRDEMGGLLRNLLGDVELPHRASRRLIGSADGNPFFLEEIISMLIDDGSLARRGGEWETTELIEVPLPPTISALLTARLDRLGPDERAVIGTASVIGREFPVAAIQELLSRLSGPELDAHLGSLVYKDLLRPAEATDRQVFRHVLIREAAYEGMPKSGRVDLHERYAGWLEDDAGSRADEHQELIGHHLERAHHLLADIAPGDARLAGLADRAGRCLATAGKHATDRGDRRATVELLTRSVALLPPEDADRARVLPDLAAASMQEGEIAQVEPVLVEALAFARSHGDRTLEARALLAISELRLLTDARGITADRLRSVAENAVAVLEAEGTDPELADALLYLGTSHWLAGDIRAMLEVSERALDLARGSSNWEAIYLSILYVGQALVLGDTPCARGARRLGSLLRQTEGHRMAQASAALDLAMLLALMERSEAAEERAADALEVFVDLGQGRWIASARLTEGLIASCRGDLRTAEPSIRAAYEWYAGRGETAQAMEAATHLARVLCDVGRLAEAQVLVDEVKHHAADYDMEKQVSWRSIGSRIHSGLGHHEAALELADEAAALVAGTDLMNLQGDVYADLAEARAAAGSPSEAEEARLNSLATFKRKGNLVGARRASSIVGRSS
jgi:class 3 adenylate cyclase/tetratricopeptide (TPR) repeat protein